MLVHQRMCLHDFHCASEVMCLGMQSADALPAQQPMMLLIGAPEQSMTAVIHGILCIGLQAFEHPHTHLVNLLLQILSLL